jgi:transcriptional regulator with XRE-family HTH domain
MWNPNDIQALRDRLGMTVADFARLLGVDARTVRRWESGDARPTGSAEAVMSGIAESLDKDPDFAGELVKVLVAAAAVGGLAYVLVKLIDRIRR